MKKTFHLVGLIGLVTLGLTSCGSSEPTVSGANAEALDRFVNQKLVWGACDPTSSYLENVDERAYAALGSRLQCATYQVPMDWHNPAHGTAVVSLSRVTASVATKRQGAIFFNPGGPGGDGQFYAAYIGYLLDQAKPDTATGQAFKQMSEQYDIIGFSPRGVGDSSLVSCGGSAASTPTHYPSEDRSQKNIDAMLRNARITAEVCQKSPFAPFINTEQTARDLDLARMLMNDAKLNYIGYSYGSWLGAWYAKMFPENTGRMLLDSNTALDKTLEESFLMQSMSFERAFRDVALAYVARKDGFFKLGATKEAVYNVYNGFLPDVKYALQRMSKHSTLTRNLYSRSSMPDVGFRLVAARVVDQLIRANPTKKLGEVNALIDDYSFSSNEEADDYLRELALDINAAYFRVKLEMPSSFNHDAEDATFQLIRCNDTPSIKDPNHWVQLGNKLAQDYPLIGGKITNNPCMYWNGPTTTKPETPANLPPILMLQSEMDAATAREGAISGWKSLPGAKMILVDNEIQHGLFPYGTECVDLPVATYFLTGELPQNNFTVCQARPIPSENQVYPVGETYTSGMGPQSVGSSAESLPAAAAENVFADPAEAERVGQLLEQLHGRGADQLR